MFNESMPPLMSKALYKWGLIVALVPLAVSLIMFPFLPEMVPTRFSGTGGGPYPIWSSKWSMTGIMASFLLPLVTLFLFAFMRLIGPIIDESAKDRNKNANPNQGAIAALSVTAFMIIIWLWLLSLKLPHI
jgi:uncharacterized membrane protein